jgi:hypothetical protein
VTNALNGKKIITIDKELLWEYLADIPSGNSGVWTVDSKMADQEEAALHNLRQKMSEQRRFVEPGVIKRLMCNNNIVMSNSLSELVDHDELMIKARGNILITGLGLGIIAFMLSRNPKVHSIMIIEQSSDVIKLIFPTLKKWAGCAIQVKQGNAFDYYKLLKTEKFFNYGWHDIWPTLGNENLPEMDDLEKKYKPFCKHQLFWAKDMCIAAKIHRDFYARMLNVKWKED